MTNPEKRQRRGAWFTMPSGGILAICFFLPAVRACEDKIVAPVNEPQFFPPYLYGLLVALAAAYWLWRRKPLPGILQASLAIGVGAAALVVFFFSFSEVGGKDMTIRQFLAASALSYCALIIFGHIAQRISAQIEGAQHDPVQDFAWLARSGAMMCCAWFAYWIVVYLCDALYGLWLSLFSSLGLLAGTWMMHKRRAAPESS